MHLVVYGIEEEEKKKKEVAYIQYYKVVQIYHIYNIFSLHHARKFVHNFSIGYRIPE